MFDAALLTAWTQDLPVCFPGRSCVYQSPLTADVINATVALTPLSPAIAAACFTVLGASLVLVGLGLKRQWRGDGVQPWLVGLVTALLLTGFVVATAVGARFDAIPSIYSDVYGQPSAPAPSSLTASWPSVLIAGDAMVLLGVVALAALTTAAAMQRHRKAKHEEALFSESRRP